MDQLTFDSITKPLFKIDKPIRLIELFAGIGAQAKALERLGTNFERYRISEWEYNAVASYRAIHCDDNKNYAKDIGKDELISTLFELGISRDGKRPMTIKEIGRLTQNKLEKIYNDFYITNNLGSITQIKGEDLGIVDIEKYCYIMTYSFPCQDLSIAGKQRGMSKGSATRSGLLWEVERLLNETENLPQVLLMENVPQVHSQDNLYDFHKWINFLESKGYSNYWQDLNAKNYGVPQNRDRCFMVSILGNFNYEFPKPFPLKLRLKDVLEKDVDEKYYLSDKGIQYLTSQAETRGEDLSKINELSLINIAHGQCKGSIIPANTMPTLLTDTANAWKVTVLEPRCVQIATLTGGKWDKINESCRRVYSSEHISPTLHTCGGG